MLNFHEKFSYHDMPTGHCPTSVGAYLKLGLKERYEGTATVPTSPGDPLFSKWGPDGDPIFSEMGT